MMTPGRLAGVFVVALLFPALGSAEPITGLVIFGDRLSDHSNMSTPTGVLPPIPPTPPANSSSSQAPPWVQHLADKLGVPVPTPSLKGGLDYAYGSTQSTAGSGLTVPTLDTQVHTFLANHTPESGQLCVLAGPSGVLHGQADPATAATKLCGEINTLAQAGAHHFLTFHLPQLQNLPSGAKLSDAQLQELNSRIADFNSDLDKGLDKLRSQWPGATIDCENIPDPHKDKPPTSSGSSGSSGSSSSGPTGSSIGTAADTAPEPGSMTLAGLGALGMAAYSWRRRKLAA